MSHNKKIDLMDYILHNLYTNNFAFEIKFSHKVLEWKPCSEEQLQAYTFSHSYRLRLFKFIVFLNIGAVLGRRS